MREWSVAQRGMRWYQIRTKHDQMSFLLRDDTGTVPVAVDDSQFLTTLAQQRSDEYNGLPEHLVHFLQDHGHSLKDEQGRDRVFRFEEGTVAKGEAVEVVGTVQTGADGELVLTGSQRAPLLVRDSQP